MHRKRKVCTEGGCRITTFYEDEGFTWCTKGHRQEDEGHLAGEDDDDYGKRKGPKHRLGPEEPTVEVTRFVRGAEALELYIECYQLILRKQLWWLMHTKGFSNKLETIVKGLWAHRISAVSHRLETMIATDKGGLIHSSQADNATGEETQDAARKKSTPTHGVAADATPMFVESLALCYVGLLFMQEPVSIGELHHWVRSGDLIYNRAILSLQPKMRDRLPNPYRQFLDPDDQLRPDRIYTAVNDLVRMFDREYGMEMPQLNHTLVLQRYIKALALPLEVEDGVKKSMRKLGLDYRFEKHEKQGYSVLDDPETQLVAMVVAVVKLLYPFDRAPRFPMRADEAGAEEMDWDLWVRETDKYHQTAKRLRHGDRMTEEELMTFSETDAYNAPKEKLDEWMDWYATTRIDDHIPRGEPDRDFTQAIYDMFPLSAATPASKPPEQLKGAALAHALTEAEEHKLKTMMAALKPRVVISEAEEADRGEGPVARLGDNPAIYRKAAQLEGNCLKFYEEVADLAGMSLKRLVRAVYLTDMKIRHWVKEKVDQLEIGGDGPSSRPPA